MYRNDPCNNQRSYGVGNFTVCAPPGTVCTTYTKTTQQTNTSAHVCASTKGVDIGVNSQIQFKK